MNMYRANQPNTICFVTCLHKAGFFLDGVLSFAIAEVTVVAVIDVIAVAVAVAIYFHNARLLSILCKKRFRFVHFR